MIKIGDRLKSERKRLRLSAAKLGELVGVHANTQYRYERGEMAPDTNYLEQLSGLGFDVGYVVTGVKREVLLTPDEELLLMDYRSLSPQEKFQASVAVRQLGLSSNNPQSAVHDAPASTTADAARAALAQAGVKVKGDAGNINTGPVDQSNMTMIVGRRARVIKRDDKK